MVQSSDAFFAVETEDDTITVERFTPGSTAPPATEVTVIDRSPAGLVQSVTRNGDLLLSCEYDTAGRGIRCADGTCSAQLTLDACGDVVSVVRTDISGVNGVASKTFTTTCVRDPLGRMTSCTAGSGNTSTTEYDSLGRPVSFTAPGRPPLLYAYDGNAETADGSVDAPFSMQVSCDISSTGSPVVLVELPGRVPASAAAPRMQTAISEVFTRDSLGRATRCDHPDGTYERIRLRLARPQQPMNDARTESLRHRVRPQWSSITNARGAPPPVGPSNRTPPFAAMTVSVPLRS